MHVPLTRSRWIRRGVALAFVGTAVAAMTGDAASQQLPMPQPAPKLQPVPAPSPASGLPARPVAVVHANIEITHDEFGKFLMDRGGADKLEIFVNKKIIELEAKRLGLTVTDTELKAAFKQSVATSGEDGVVITEKDFIRGVLPKYGKSLYEWMEDIERPRLLLTKMCRNRIKISEADLKVQYDRRFGEMRQVQMIMWPTGDDLKSIQKIYERIRESGNEFDSEARKQANPGLAAACGHIKPITRHLASDDKKVEEVAFQLKDGEVSQVIHTQLGYIVMKLVKVIPANDKAKFETERPGLEKAAFETLLSAEIPKYFAELRKLADPKFLYSGPGEWKSNTNFLDGVPDVIKAAGATNPVVPGAGGR